MDDTGKARGTALRGYGILDTPNEEQFDAVVRQAASVLGTPMALLSLIDENRQWLKARVGLDATEVPLSISFCTHAIRGPDVFVIEDATRDPRFASNPLVTGSPDIRFYAGVPLKASGGVRIGTLCVLDTKPHRSLTAAEEAQMVALADQVMVLMEERKARAERSAA